MVNTGKPSTGCQNCRARHIKCDEGKPACQKCLRTNRTCQGYRNLALVKFRNITQYQVKVAGRIRSPRPKASRSVISQKQGRRLSLSPVARSPVSEGSRSSSGDELALQGSPVNFDNFSSLADSPPLLFQESPSLLELNSSEDIATSASLLREVTHPFCEMARRIPGQISSGVECQAACFFASNFVVLPNAKCTCGVLDFLLPLLQRCTPDSPLPIAFLAVSLYAFASRPGNHAILETANRTYVKALHALNLYIRNEKTACDNDTLASSLVLAMVEVLVPSTAAPRSTGWISHISGAARLLKARGERYLDTSIGQSIFRCVRYQLTLDSLLNGKEIEFGIEWWGSRVPMDDVHQRASHINLKASQLRADVKRLLLQPLHTQHMASVRAVTRLLECAEALEEQSAAWLETLLTSGHVTPLKKLHRPSFSAAPLAFSGFSIAVLYMISCATRLVILEIIIRCTAWLLSLNDSTSNGLHVVHPTTQAPTDYRTAPAYLRCAVTGQEIVRATVAGVPYFFNEQDTGNALASCATFACGRDEPGTVKSLSGMCCMWPVFMAAASDFASDRQREYLAERLKFGAEKLGIQSSTIFLEVLTDFRTPSSNVVRDRLFQQSVL